MAAEVRTDCKNAISDCNHSKQAVSQRVKSIHRSNGGFACSSDLNENTGMISQAASLWFGINHKLLYRSSCDSLPNFSANGTSCKSWGGADGDGRLKPAQATISSCSNASRLASLRERRESARLFFSRAARLRMRTLSAGNARPVGSIVTNSNIVTREPRAIS
jgi:hypothetical protein